MNDQAPILPVLAEAHSDSSGYEEDFSAWIDVQVELLRAKKFEQLDLDNVIEELESMGRRDKRELQSRILVLISHLLKCQFQPEKKSSAWIGTINEQRSQIDGLLSTSPSLRRIVDDYVSSSYAKARLHAASETQLSLSAFPSTIPYSVDQLLDSEYFP